MFIVFLICLVALVMVGLTGMVVNCLTEFVMTPKAHAKLADTMSHFFILAWFVLIMALPVGAFVSAIQ